MHQLNFFSTKFSGKRKQINCEMFLDETDAAIRWTWLMARIEELSSAAPVEKVLNK
ncbi:transposase-like protein TnpA3 [Pusillimonas sp. T7-7]|nr:transposase-like protein TnpA3 [Pusillimonas sp. T7-7]